MGIVNVEYGSFIKDKQFINSVSFELLPNTTLVLSQGDEGLSMTMVDTSTENTELSGVLDDEAVEVLIRCLSLIKNQKKMINVEDAEEQG